MEKVLPTSRLRPFGVRQRALGMAIDKKLYLILAEQSGIRPGPASIRKAIREQDSFHSDGHFDLIKYKDLLRLNGLTPTDFEQLVAQDLMIQHAARLSSRASVSRNFAQEVLEIKQNRREVSVVRVQDRDVEKLVELSPQEISDYLASDEGKQKVGKLFERKKSSFEQSEQVRARHILFKGADSLTQAQKVRGQQITAKNFATFAKKHSQDASTKPKGGDLGWFGRGQMVAEFDQIVFSLGEGVISEPVKTSFGHHLILVEGRRPFVPAQLADHQKKLARELLRQGKGEEVARLRREMAQKFRQKTGKKAWQKLGKKIRPLSSVRQVLEFAGLESRRSETHPR